MEKIISDEEKLRRAIEISQRRNTNNNYRNQVAKVNVNENKRDLKLFKKMVLQIIICLLIYIIFYLISTTNFVFSEQCIKSINDILNYDINFSQIYNNFMVLMETKVNANQLTQENTILQQNNITSGIVEQMAYNNSITNNIEINEQPKEVSNIDEEASKDIENENKTQMELDAEKAKKICEFTKPLSGTITSEFGEREVISKVMSADHKGIDIAAKSGTNIKSAISGTVSVAEENSEYGKFIKIVNGDVMTVYAHCKTLKVKKGDKVKIGQTIATVGSTGNSTGPHLHFEIRLSNRYINPQYVIEF